jgi:fumarate reductase flavoprotein subunit
MVNIDITYGPELRFIPPPGKGFEQLLPSKGLGMKLMGMMMPLVPKAVIHRRIKRLLVTWQHPEDSLLDNGAIMVNRDGRRFTNEKVSPEREIAVAAQPEKIAYIVLDERLIDVYSEWPNFISTAPEIAYAYVADYLRLRPDVAAEARSLDDLAATRGLPADGLHETIDQFNRYANGEEADAFGRLDDSHPLVGGRWVLLGPVKAYFTTTEGGASVNEQMQVMDQDNGPIPGLYAVGQNGLGGQVLWGHGLHIAWAITSGRLVGELLGKQSHAS